MQTSALITLVTQTFPDWGRPMIMSVLNEFQKFIYSQVSNYQMRIFDTATGKDPILTTVSGTYEYEISISNGFTNDAQRVTNVYTADIDSSEDVMLLRATEDNKAIIRFKTDPGNGNYYIRCYMIPNEILVESTNLSIPPDFHLTHVFEGICGWIEQMRSGKSERWYNFLKTLLPDLITKLNTDISVYDAKITLRGF